MTTMNIDPRFVPAQLNLMMTPRRARGVRNKRRLALKHLMNWLRSWGKTLIAELVSLGAGLEKAL